MRRRSFRKEAPSMLQLRLVKLFWSRKRSRGDSEKRRLVKSSNRSRERPVEWTMI